MSASFLQSVIAKKKEQLVNLPPAKRFRTNGEILDEKLQKQKQEQEKKELETKKDQVEHKKVEETNNKASEEEEKPQHNREEVIRRLRQVGLVVTYFGETDLQREKRWLKHAAESTEDSAFAKGFKNDYDEIIRNLDNNMNQNKTEDNSNSDLEQVLSIPIENIFDGLDLCPEHKVLLMFRRLLEEWKRDIKDREEELLKTVKGKKQIATVEQSSMYLKPLFKALRTRTLSRDILDCLIQLVEAVRQRDYTSAGNFYIQMAVGNAPWPIGVTMVGIHERSAREKIFSNQVAHVLNDETQRKYIQCVKRLVSFCQRKYATDPSRQIG